MGNKNVNLGQYDMVLALSESKINAEFKKMLNQGIISRKWQFFTDLTGSVHMNHTHNRFEEIKKLWLQEAGKLGAEYADYMIFVDAILEAPKISFIKDDHKELLFSLLIKEGTFHYLDKVKKTCDLKDKQYTFRVPISKLRITMDAMYLVEDETMNELRKEGLNDRDFLIEAILMDFQRADIAQYSTKESVLPADLKTKAYLQIAVTNYFTAIAQDKDNPYVLGYAINQRKLVEREKALLYPTGASFSTSPSKIERAPAFNFLLLTDHAQFPGEPQGGRIDRSLIEEAIDKTATVSGVIAVDFETFQKTYLNEINSAVVSAFTKSLSSSGTVKVTQWEDGRGGKFVYRGGGVDMTFWLRKEKVFNDAKARNISVIYSLQIEGDAHKEVEAIIGTVGVNQRFSTRGRYTINGKTGSEGKLTIQLNASDKGKIEIRKPVYEPPLIGRDTEDPDYKHEADRIWLKVSTIFKNISGIEDIYTSKFLNKLIDNLGEIDFDELEDFSNKVVLPGSNVYTFKNIRLLNSRQDESDAVLFDIAYAVALD